MWPDHLNIDVSRETIDKLEIYYALLLKWQKAINLVSPNTLGEAWVRHFADSAQVSRHLQGDVSRESSIVFDIGSGAGFPGLVLAIIHHEFEVHLIESDQRKCQFLKTVSRETGVDVTVHNVRIEDAQFGVTPNIVTARALADVSSLLKYVEVWAQENLALECLFLKGAQVSDEITQAKAQFDFEYALGSSITSPEASVLHVSNIKRKTVHKSF